MGNQQSGMVYQTLEKEIPPVKEMGYDSAHGYMDKGPKIFADDKDREQFICMSDLAVHLDIESRATGFSDELYADIRSRR